MVMAAPLGSPVLFDGLTTPTAYAGVLTGFTDDWFIL